MYKFAFVLVWGLNVLALFSTTYAKSKLRSDFDKRVQDFVNATIHRNDCDMYSNLIKIEFTDEFCGDGFLGNVCKK